MSRISKRDIDLRVYAQEWRSQHVVHLSLAFGGPYQLISKTVAIVCTPSVSSPFSCRWHLSSFDYFNLSHSDRGKTKSPSRFHLYFLGGQGGWTFKKCLSAICISSPVNSSVSFHAPFTEFLELSPILSLMHWLTAILMKGWSAHLWQYFIHAGNVFRHWDHFHPFLLLVYPLSVCKTRCLLLSGLVTTSSLSGCHPENLLTLLTN